MVAIVGSITLVGLEGHRVQVEVSVAQGLPAFTIVGLPDASIQEARERVRSAVTAAGEEWPMQRITVNLSPAHLRKGGSGFDLAIALGVLVARGRITQESLARTCVLGELSLDGRVRRIRGVLPATAAAARAGAHTVLVPSGNAREAALVQEVAVFGIDHLAEAVAMLRGTTTLEPATPRDDAGADEDTSIDLQDVRGQQDAKFALEVAAAGGHNILLVGAPGGGKTMLARRLPGILPPLGDEEALEVTRVYSVAGLLPDDAGLIRTRPFRAPHHTASSAGLIGGGGETPHVGEVSLAHRGVLFMDEYGEFRTDVAQALRQPLEDGVITIVRARWTVTFPARFMLVAGSNPCPCGFFGDQRKACACTKVRRDHYRERLSGPVMDRVDIQVEVPRIEKDELFRAEMGDPTALVAKRVAEVREMQRERWGPFGFETNADIPPRDIDRLARLSDEARASVEDAIERNALTARAAHRVIRVARTLADLEGHVSVGRIQVLDAVDLRVRERAD